MFLIRGYQEDGAETFPAGTILDTTLPLWRMSEVLLHAEKLASLLRKDADTAVTVHFRAMFTGLRGRVLRSWANPLSDLLVEGHAPRRSDKRFTSFTCFAMPAFAISAIMLLAKVRMLSTLLQSTSAIRVSSSA
nr:hypothetical protein [Sinorhizobium meliloti]